jgi:hypothetical protein
MLDSACPERIIAARLWNDGAPEEPHASAQYLSVIIAAGELHEHQPREQHP